MPTVLITGGHAGIGLECAKQLAAGPRLNLLLAGRNLERVERAAAQLRATHGVRISTVKLDISSLASVREAAARCRAMLDSGEVDSLQAILCNAGAQFQGPISYSADGYEETFATNCLGHFLLVELLIDRVADQGRIVFTASGTHDPDTMDGKMVGAAVEPDAQALARDGKNGAKPISGGKRYTTSKLCTILYAYELDRRLRSGHSSIASIAFDPGLIPETGLVRTSPKLVQWLARTSAMKWVFKRLGVTMGSMGFSGAGLARMVADPSFADGSGKYFQSHNGSLIEARSSKVSYDKQRAAKLWDDSKLLVKLQPNEEPVILQ
jgi:NAD(P)-dependent dehydrogenase (short-subunit alcohol dehydrogenase family)